MSEETIYERTVMGHMSSLIINLPTKEAKKMNLTHKQKFMIFVRNNLIHMIPMQIDEYRSKNTEERSVTLLKNDQARIILPAKYAELFEIKKGDVVQIKARKNIYNKDVFIIRPKYQNKHVRMKHEGDKTTMSVYGKNKDGTIKEEPTKTFETTYENAHNMVSNKQDDKDPGLDKIMSESDKDESTKIDMSVPEGWKVPLLKLGEKQDVGSDEQDDVLDV